MTSKLRTPVRVSRNALIAIGALVLLVLVTAALAIPQIARASDRGAPHAQRVAAAVDSFARVREPVAPVSSPDAAVAGSAAASVDSAAASASVPASAANASAPAANAAAPAAAAENAIKGVSQSPDADVALEATAAPVAAPAGRTQATQYTVQKGDNLTGIAKQFGVSVDAIVKANHLADAGSIKAGQVLLIPGTGGSLTLPASSSASAAHGSLGVAGASSSGAAASRSSSASSGRGTLWDRLPSTARTVSPASPLYHKLWVTYYGSPGTPVMGILGEYSIDGLVPRLRSQAAAYQAAAGSTLTVRPAFHLVYGTATKAGGASNSHLAYLSDKLVMSYINRAEQEHFGVILDVQIGNVSPLAAITPAFKYLKYANVEVALDPEFAMVTPGQTVPGAPPGAITSASINAVQAALRSYLQKEGIGERKFLIVHQFLPSMIINKADITAYDDLDVLICADGYGGPAPKISKYNGFMTSSVQFGGFKLFYRWDVPLMTPRQALGIDPYSGYGYIDTTPSLIIYQ